MEPHPSDGHIHWTDSCADMEKIREAWDNIAALGQIENLKTIIGYVRNEALLTEAEQHVGEDL